MNTTTGASESCTTAFHKPTDTGVQVACQVDNVSECHRKRVRTILMGDIV